MEQLAIKDNISEQQAAASYLLQAATLSVFPNSSLVSAKTSSLFFNSSFEFSFQFLEEHLPLILERMIKISSKSLVFEVKEMVPSCFEEYVVHKGQSLPQFYSENQQLIRFIEIEGIPVIVDTKVDLISMPEFFQLVLKEEQEDLTTIYGTVADDKKSLKLNCRQLKESKRLNQLVKGQKEKYFVRFDNSFIWRPSGLKRLCEIESLYKNELQKLKFQLISTDSSSHFEQHKIYFDKIIKQPTAKVYEIVKSKTQEVVSRESLFETAYRTQILASIFVDKKELRSECISSLHFIQKISTMLHLNKESVVVLNHSCGKPYLASLLNEANITYQIEESDVDEVRFFYVDCLGNKQSGPSLSIEPITEDCFQIRCLFTPSLEGIFGLIIENES